VFLIAIEKLNPPTFHAPLARPGLKTLDAFEHESMSSVLSAVYSSVPVEVIGGRAGVVLAISAACIALSEWLRRNVHPEMYRLPIRCPTYCS
jgi:hypothetical protein